MVWFYFDGEGGKKKQKVFNYSIIVNQYLLRSQQN